MPGVIDPETMNIDGLPGIWSPVQWELTEQEARQRAGYSIYRQPVLVGGCN